MERLWGLETVGFLGLHNRIPGFSVQALELNRLAQAKAEGGWGGGGGGGGVGGGVARKREPGIQFCRPTLASHQESIAGRRSRRGNMT